MNNDRESIEKRRLLLKTVAVDATRQSRRRQISDLTRGLGGVQIYFGDRKTTDPNSKLGDRSQTVSKNLWNDFKPGTGYNTSRGNYFNTRLK